MSRSTVLQKWPVALPSRLRVSEQDLELRKRSVRRRVLARQTIARSPSPLSEFQPAPMLREQRRGSEERLSFISPHLSFVDSLYLPKTIIMSLVGLTVHVS